ncbi:unnamed protein product, partial [Heterotrigona itama]
FIIMSINIFFDKPCLTIYRYIILMIIIRGVIIIFSYFVYLINLVKEGINKI